MNFDFRTYSRAKSMELITTLLINAYLYINCGQNRSEWLATSILQLGKYLSIS